MSRKPFYNPNQPDPLHHALVSGGRWYAIAIAVLFLGLMVAALHAPDNTSDGNAPIERQK